MFCLPFPSFLAVRVLSEMSACPSVKVSLNQPKPTGTQKVTPSFMQPWREQMELQSLLLSLFISGSISDTLICFSASFSVSLSPSLAFLSLSPSRSLLLFPLPYLLFLLLLPASPLPLLLNVFSLSVVSGELNTCVFLENSFSFCGCGFSRF